MLFESRKNGEKETEFKITKPIHRWQGFQPEYLMNNLF